MGTSGCYMLNIDHDQITNDTLIKGCLGRVQDGILPTKLGLEMGQSAMGDLFAWLASITNTSVNEFDLLKVLGRMLIIIQVLHVQYV